MELLKMIVENGVEYLLREEADTTYYYPVMKNQSEARIIKAIHKNKTTGQIYTSFWNPKGERHRLDGPAIIHSNGQKEFFVNGEKIEVKNEEEFLRLMKLQAFK